MDYNALLIIWITWFTFPPEPEIEIGMLFRSVPCRGLLEKATVGRKAWREERKIPDADSRTEAVLFLSLRYPTGTSLMWKLAFFLQRTQQQTLPSPDRGSCLSLLHTQQRHVSASLASLSFRRRHSKNSPADLSLCPIASTAPEHWHACVYMCA